jgi:hypothetical protein
MRRIRTAFAVMLLGLVLCTAVENTIVRAYADWIECFDDPTTFELTDIRGLAVHPVPLHDPQDELRDAVRAALGVWGAVTPAEAREPDVHPAESDLSRAPPAR